MLDGAIKREEYVIDTVRIRALSKVPTTLEVVAEFVNLHVLITVPHLDHKLLDTTPLTS